MKISLIICIYNTERHYFEECLSSVFDGTLAFHNDNLRAVDFEVIVIDDGSDIDYSDIVRKYGIKYRKTSNNGIFSARLIGIDMAKGEYISFVDSDDTVTFNYHRTMIEAAEKEGSDIVINDWAFWTRHSSYFCKNDSTIAENISVCGREVLEFFFRKCGREHSYYVVWNKLYRASVLKNAANEISSLNIPAYYNYSEDVLINFYAFSFARKLSNIHTGYYLYRIHPSQSVNVISERRLESQIFCMSMTFCLMKEGLVMLGREDLLPPLRDWQGLMSRTHYTYAVSKSYKMLYAVICKAYEVSELKRNTREDSYAYRSVHLLPENRKEIDACFIDLYCERTALLLDYDKKDRYIATAVSGLRYLGLFVNYTKKGERVPKPYVSFIARILHSRTLRSIGNLVFKKGTGIRAFLKRFL